MQVAIITDAFPPLRSSGAVQLRDLSREFERQGHRPVVLVASPGLEQAWQAEELDGVKVIRLRAPRTKDVGYLRRTIAEFLMPYAMLRNLRTCPVADKQWDAVVWYSPSIFLAPVAKALKVASDCRSYLILRDIFPHWAVDMGLMGRGLPFWFFTAVERSQYSVADVIGVQTPGNLHFFDKWASKPGRRLEVLQNWLAEAPISSCSIDVAAGRLAGRKIFVYAGNMGVAQGMGRLLDLATSVSHRSDLGFLFVGRGSDAQRLRQMADERSLENVEFHDEIDPSEIPGLYAQCHVGLIALDPRHRTHNIPGKFLSYMQSGLPVLANVNPGNDLVDLISEEGVGRSCTDNNVESLVCMALNLVDRELADPNLQSRCRVLAARLFSPRSAVRQIVAALQSESARTLGKHGSANVGAFNEQMAVLDQPTNEGQV